MKGYLFKQGKFWYFTYDIEKGEDGKRRRKTINTKCTNKAQAMIRKKEILEEKETELKENEEKEIEVEAEAIIEEKDQEITVDEYLEEWLEIHKFKIAQTTYDGYWEIVHRNIIPYFKGLELNKLKPSDVQNYYDYLLRAGRKDGQGGLSPRTIKANHNVLKKALNRAVMPMELIEKNPTDYVELPKIKKYEAEIYDIEEIKTILNIGKDEPVNIAIWIASSLGLRRGEVLGLRWDDVDFEKDLIYIINTRVQTREGVIEKSTKTEKSKRVFYLPIHLKLYLEKLYKRQMKNKLACGSGYHEGNFICAWDDGSPVKPDYVSRRFRRLLEINNLPIIRFHDLRHSNATLLLEAGINMKWLSEWLGHSNIAITMDIYGHVTDKIKKEVSKTINNVFNIS